MIASIRQPSSWLISAGGVILYVWAPSILYGLGLSAVPVMPWWVSLVAPLVVYGVLFVGLRGLSIPRQIGGTLGLYGVHFLLGLVIEAIHAAGEPRAPGVPLEQALWMSRTAPLLQLLSVPLVMWPFRDFVARDRSRRTPGPHLVLEDFTPPPSRSTPPPVRVGSAPVRLSPLALPSSLSRAEVADASAPSSAVRWIFTQPAQAEPEEYRTAGAVVEAAPAPPVPAVEVHEPPPAPVEATDLAPSPAALAEVAIPPAEAELVRVTGPAPDVEVAAPVETGIEPSPAVEADRPLVIDETPAVMALSSARAEAELAPIVRELASPPARSLTVLAQAERLCAPLTRVGSLQVDAQILMGVTLFAVYSARLAREAVMRDAFRVLSRLEDSPDLRAVGQVTLRAAAGAMVLTPLGRLGVGPVLIAAVPRRGSLALLEILSWRVAAESHAKEGRAAGRRGAGAPPSEASKPNDRASSGPPDGATTGRPAAALAEIALPLEMAQLARMLGAGDGVAPLALQDPAGRLSLYLFLAPGVDGHGIGRVACALRDLMEIDGEPGGIGAIQSVALRLGDQRLVIRRGAGSEHTTLLVSAGPTTVPPGLVHLQLDRAAQRLAAV